MLKTVGKQKILTVPHLLWQVNVEKYIQKLSIENLKHVQICDEVHPCIFGLI